MITMPKMIMAVILVFALTGTPVSAQTDTGDQYQVPQGCAAFLTVQEQSCSVSHYWRCENAPHGQYGFAFVRQSSPVFTGISDDQAQIIWTQYPDTNIELVGTETENTRTAITRLLQTGQARTDYRLQMRFINGPELQSVPISTIMQQSGEIIEIDDEPLRVVDVTGTMLDETFSGQSLLHEGLGILFTRDLERVTLAGETTTTNQTPVDFIYPGEAGFLSNAPQHGCDIITSSYTAPFNATGGVL